MAKLSGGKVPAPTELETAEAELERAEADEAGAKAAVDEARATLRSNETDLAKASIYSPVDGVVLARSIEPGQTVAASLEAPVLFTLAESLAQMELQVDVDEADVGQVRAGQPATFTVDAYPNRRFPAQIRLVRYGSETTDNVVTYKTISNVDNQELRLRPGMTATAEIVTAELEDVLLVPNVALRAIRRNLLRAFLTILGIVIGVSAVITMVTLGNGATKVVSDQIASLGSNLIMLRPGQMLGPGRDSAGAPKFRAKDAETIAAEIGAARFVAPVANKSVTVVSGANNWSTVVTGSTAAYFSAGNWRLATGRIFSAGEEIAGKAACVIGETVRKELFGAHPAVGGAIRVKNFACEVIGVLASRGQSAMGTDQDDVVVIPLRTLQRRLTGNRDVNTLMVSVADSASIEQVKNDLQSLMRERRGIDRDEDDNFSVLDTRQIAEAMTGTTKVMTALLGAVAAVSLLVGGIGIMNIMLVSVTERTREIGIRRAIGALRGEVLLQFLVEAVVLSSLGGLIGILLATVASIGLAGLMQVPYLFDLRTNLLSFLFSAAIGVIFGYFSARRAAQLDPIEALRYE